MNALEDELEKLEEQIFATGSGGQRRAGEARETIQRLYALKRKAGMVKHAVAPLMEAVGRLYGGSIPRPCMGLSAYYSDVYDHLHQTDGYVEPMREAIATGNKE